MHIESELEKTVSHFDNLASMDAGRARGGGGGREGQRHRGGRGGRVHALTINEIRTILVDHKPRPDYEGSWSESPP